MTINYFGHRWIVLDEKSTLGENYVVLQRKNYLADLKRYGQVATKIDASIRDLRNQGIVIK